MKKLLMFVVAAVMIGVVGVIYAGTQYNWGTSTGSNWITPDNTNIQSGQILVIGSTVPYPSVTTSSTTAAALGGFTIAQIQQSTPTIVGAILYCSDCTATPVCVSTGITTKNSYAAISSTSTTNKNICQ